MDKLTILKKITPVFEDILDLDNIELKEENVASDLPNWDSLNNIRLMVAIEEEMSIKFDMHEINNLANVGELIDVIIEKLK